MTLIKNSEKLKVIFFDRDGTLIKNVPYLNNYKLIDYFSDTFSTLQTLKAKGYHFAIVTNQSGIPRGLISEVQLQEIHNKMIQDFKEKDITFLEILHAPYLPDSDHIDRKPNPGMILKILDKYSIDQSKSIMVGDSLSDYQAGLRAQLNSYLISEDKPDEVPAEHHLSRLADLVKKI